MEVIGKPDWELRIARIEWTGQGVANVIAQSDPEPLISVGESIWSGAFPTFPRVSGAMGQLAINAKGLESTPVLMLADATATPMLRVPATDLWIENGEWLRERRKGQEVLPKWPRFRKASLNAKAGRVQIRIAQDVLDLELSPADWSWNDVLQLERDLRATALELVLERKSAATATQEAERLTGSLEKLKAALTAFAEQCEKIARSPIRELRSNVVQVRAHRAKPYPAGLIDLMRRPGASHVRSRVSLESIDCPENRYIAFLQHRCDLVLQLCETMLEQRRATHQQRLGDLQNQLEKMPETAPTSMPVSAGDIKIEREAIQRHLARIASKTFDTSEYREWLLGKDVKYSAPGLLKWILNDRLNALDVLAGTTTRPTTNAERHEYRRSRDAMLTKQSQMQKEITSFGCLGQDFGAVERRIQLHIRTWRSHGVQPSPSAPTSVALRMNMPYAKAIAAYREVRSAFRDETTMTALFSASCVREHGLVDLNLLYERWCTVQVVRVILSLGFEPDKEDALSLVARALVTRRNLRTEDEKLTFTRGAVSLSVQMEPGMETVIGRGTKYPDLVLKLNGGAQAETVVLDVKCHEFAESKGIPRGTTLPSSELEIQKMYFGPDDDGERNYSMEGQNRVFLLHPCRGGIPEPSDFQHWSARSFYGERYVYKWQDKKAGPDHRYGAVYVRPGELDDLRRLLGMLLNMATLPQLKGKVESEFQDATRCLHCGGKLKKWKENSTDKGIPKYECTCESCGEFYVFTHCVLCSRRLVKCGMYWSYHSLAGQIGNVRCPRCGTSLPALERSNSVNTESRSWEGQEDPSWEMFQLDEDDSLAF